MVVVDELSLVVKLHVVFAVDTTPTANLFIPCIKKRAMLSQLLLAT